MKKLWWGIFSGVLFGVLILAPESNFANRVWQLFLILQDSIATVANANPDFTQYVMMFLIFNMFAFLIFNYLFIRGKITTSQVFGITIKFLLDLAEFIVGVLKEDLGIIHLNYLHVSLFLIPFSIFLVNFLMSSMVINQKMLLTTFIDSALAWELLFVGLMFHSLATQLT